MADCAWCRFRALWIGVPLALALLSGACAARAGGQPSDETLVVPYRLRTIGIGSQPVAGVLVLDEGSEPDLISKSLIAAFQRLELSVVNPPLGPADRLLPGREWTTDTAPIAQAVVDKHNGAAPLLKLASDKYYGIQYTGQYAIGREELRFTVRALLHERGSLSDFKRYPGEMYSAVFFADLLKQAIREALAQAATQRK